MNSTSNDFGGGGLTSQREIHLKDLMSVVRHHWKVVVLLPIMVAGSAWWTSRNAVPTYWSTLKVQISSPKQVFARLDDIDVDEFALRTDPILSEALVLQTQGLALLVVDEDQLQLQLRLADPTDVRADIFSRIHVNPDSAPLDRYRLLRSQNSWQLRDRLGNTLARGNYGQPVTHPDVGFSLVVRPAVAGEPVETVFDIVSREDAAAEVTAGLSYQVMEQTTAVDITYTGTDQSLVPQILNFAAVQLRDMGVDRARQTAQGREEFIATSLEEFETEQQVKLRELQTYREAEQITNLSAEEAGITERITTADIERQEIRSFRATMEEALGTGDSIGIETLHRLSAIRGISDNSALNFQIGALLQLYDQRNTLTAGDIGLSSNNPQVKAIDERLVAGSAALREAAQTALRSTDARIARLNEQIDAFRERLATYPGKESRISQIQQELAIQNQTVEYLLGQLQQARMQSATIAPYIRILDGASPAITLGTTRNEKIFLGFLVGLLLGLGGAFFLEYLDQSIKSSSDVERVLAMPVLGMIPQDSDLTARNDRRKGLKVLDSLDPEDTRAEAFRSLRTNVTFVGAEKTLQYIAITSPSPGEGKSTIASNLAATLGMGGNKTLLIDGDLRRPLLHHAFGLVQEPGLTDVLIGRADSKEAIRPGVAQNLDLLPSGPTPPNPSELLGSDSMHALINELRREYDYIIFDTPPVLPVTDAAVISSNSDATIMVIRAGSTEEQAAQRALAQLKRVHARLAGAVLNDVSQKHDRYYYSYDSYRSEPPSRSRPVRKSTPSKIASMM